MDPRLVLHASSEEIGNYVALSHCWGPEQLHPPETTWSNLRQRQECIDLTTLPSTFRDAVLVTRNLGVQYLWIDSLCIVQDDTADWQTESSKMAGYYSNAYLVISAAQAEDSTQGFLDAVDAHPYLIPPCAF
ncbi:het domain-containing protein [Colletotrichum asianum]|uniref:Het domain-containing protein n=1 Tax=Colletotrichum asianum TaxID=702518 RepID=A0A8H3W0Z4_9PEZI|nr:het domain-containing protein [Colletotrichum asianum]